VLSKHYLTLTKPGIIFGNAITTLGGFYLAKAPSSFVLLLLTVVGLSLVIASGCVFNNFFDRDIDSLMERTKQRPSVLGLVSGPQLLFFGFLLGLFGFSVLFFFVNLLSAFMALIGLIFYVVFYTLYFKRSSVWGTAIGSVSGAIPPVVGYCAASGVFNNGALVLFVMLVLWQMPHSYAIAIYRLNDYRAANLPVLPVKKTMQYTKFSMFVYIIAFGVVSLLPTLLGYAGWYYFFVALCLNVYWIYIAAKGFNVTNDYRWAKQVFSFSILIITALCFMMVMD